MSGSTLFRVTGGGTHDIHEALILGRAITGIQSLEWLLYFSSSFDLNFDFMQNNCCFFIQK